jgi:hypothetical protein
MKDLTYDGWFESGELHDRDPKHSSKKLFNHPIPNCYFPCKLEKRTTSALGIVKDPPSLAPKNHFTSTTSLETG